MTTRTRIRTHKVDTQEYPIVTRQMIERARDLHSMEVAVYHSAVVTVPIVSYDAVQDVFSTLYSVHGADPKYLFIAEVDATAFSASILDTQKHYQAAQIINVLTKRLVHVIALPDLPHGTLLCGFFSATEAEA